MYFAAFLNTTDCMEAEEWAKSAGFSVTIIPTPRAITHSCGLSLRFNGGRADAAAFFVSLPGSCELYVKEGSAISPFGQTASRD